MGAQGAWDLGLGGPVTVAIVDSGVDLTHPDLVANLWTNPREVPGNGVDDDGDGHVDDVHGWDTIAGDADPSDDNGHGTSLAGVVAARGDNRIGVAGVAWRARWATAAATSTPCRCTRRRSRTPTSSGSPRRHVTARSASCRTSAGTRSTSPPRETGSSPRRWAAGYERRSGTSLAAATVAGAAALMAAAAPDLDAAALRGALLGTARHRHRLPIAGGTLDLARAMRRARALSSAG